jgi:hypothetical protein
VADRWGDAPHGARRHVKGTMQGTLRAVRVRRTAGTGRPGSRRGADIGRNRLAGLGSLLLGSSRINSYGERCRLRDAGPVYCTQAACQRKTSAEPHHQRFVRHAASRANNPDLLPRPILPPLFQAGNMPTAQPVSERRLAARSPQGLLRRWVHMPLEAMAGQHQKQCSPHDGCPGIRRA